VIFWKRVSIWDMLVSRILPDEREVDEQFPNQIQYLIYEVRMNETDDGSKVFQPSFSLHKMG